MEIEKILNSKHTINLGSDHFVRFWSWKPNRKLNPQYRKIPDIEKGGLIVIHRSLIDDKKNGLQKNEFHESMISFDTPEVRLVFPQGPFWTAVSLDIPTLHVEPSLLCDPAKGGCGDHGFIRAGRWLVA